MKQFADKIREYRLQNGLTQQQLAQQLFVSRQAVSKWEQGRGYPSMSILEDLAKLLNTTIDQLIRYQQQDTSQPAPSTLKKQTKKILLFLLPFLINLVYMWIYSTISSDFTLADFVDLTAYQAHLQIVYNYKTSVHFIVLIVLIPLILNIIIYILTVVGVLKIRSFKIILIIVNAVVLIIAFLSALIVCINQGNTKLSLGLMGGYLTLLACTSIVIVLFILDANKSQPQTQALHKGDLNKLPTLLIAGAFYIIYMSIFLTIIYFGNDSGVRHNLLYTYGNMVLTNGLLIFIPAIITVCLFLLVIAKKTRFSIFLGVTLAINSPPILIALFLALLSLAPAGGLTKGIYFLIGNLLAIIIEIVTLTKLPSFYNLEKI